jgi:hypothetical protein
MLRRTIMLAGLSIAAASGCAAPVEPAPAEEAVAEQEQAATDVRDGDFTYYAVRRDPRKCAWPLCGGYWVRRVNHAVTICPNGARISECYVASAELKRLDLGPSDEAAFEQELAAGRALVRATLHSDVFPSFGDLGQIVVSEGWHAATKVNATGTFYRLVGFGRACPGRGPCASIRESELNGGPHAVLTGVDLEPSEAGRRAIAAGLAEMRREGILAAGANHFSPGPDWPAHPERVLVASQFYTRVVPQEVPIPCAGFMGRLCPGELVCDITVQHACHGADLPGVCRRLPEVCVGMYEPVCACNGATYANDCERLRARAQLDHEGACTND